MGVFSSGYDRFTYNGQALLLSDCNAQVRSNSSGVKEVYSLICPSWPHCEHVRCFLADCDDDGRISVVADLC